MRWLLCLVLGCGRFGFAPPGTSTSGDGGTTGDGIAGDGTIVGTPNIAFVTRTTFNGALGGLAGADAQCMTAAANGGLPGTYVAWLSTSTVDAVDRLAGSRGWVRTDGVPALDSIEAYASANQIFQPIKTDEMGVVIPGGQGFVFTGTGYDGRLGQPIETCGDWTSTTGTHWFGDSSAGSGTFSALSNGGPCVASYSLFCFGVGNVATITPAPAPAGGRYIFLSSPRTAPGLAALDALCTNDATAAGLPGTYRAMVATTTSTIQMRFVADARPIHRIDGTVVAASFSGLIGATDLFSFVNQYADGTYWRASTPRVWTGSDRPINSGTTADTCNDWMSMSSATIGHQGDPARSYGYAFFGHFNGGCNQQLPVLCLQQ